MREVMLPEFTCIDIKRPTSLPLILLAGLLPLFLPITLQTQTVDANNTSKEHNEQPSSEERTVINRKHDTFSPEKPEAKQHKKRPYDPRIYASAPVMSNAPGSPKTFEGDVVRTTENGVHFKIDFQGADSREKMGYFLFELRGLKGRENVRIDLTNMGRWSNSKSIVPMYSYGVEDLSDLTALQAHPPENGRFEQVKTTSGEIVQKTKGVQKWHYFRNVEVNGDQQTITVRQQFPEDMTHTCIAHRVPYTFGYHLNFMDKLEERSRYGAEGLTVHEVGETEGGRPLHVIELENPTDPDATEKPVICMISGEHPDEMDTYHSTTGAIQFLLSDRPAAKRLRRQATFLFVPVLDPDGLVRNEYENIVYTFVAEGGFDTGGPSKTSKEYGGWFRNWINNGRRLDILINQHNVESSESSDHIFNYIMEPEHERFKEDKKLYRRTVNNLEKRGFRADESIPKKGYVPDRLGGFLRHWFGTMQTFVELNSQAVNPGRKLTLYELQVMGATLAESAVEHLYSEQGQSLLKKINRKRKKRSILYNRYRQIERRWESGDLWSMKIDSPMDMEKRLWYLPTAERDYSKYWRIKQSDEKEWTSRFRPRSRLWFRDLYDRDGIFPGNIPKFDR